MPPLNRADFQQHYTEAIKKLVRKRIHIERLGRGESELRIDGKDILLDRSQIVERLAEEIINFTARFYLEMVPHEEEVK